MISKTSMGSRKIEEENYIIRRESVFKKRVLEVEGVKEASS